MRKVFNSFILLTGLFLLAACDNDLQNPPQLADNASGMGRLTVALDGTGGRTLLPQAPEFSRYALRFRYMAGGVSDINETADSLPFSIELVPGNWNVTVTGYVYIESAEGIVNGHYPAASGEETVYIAPGVTTPVSVDLHRENTGARGVFQYDIGLPTEGIGSATLNILRTDRTVAATRNLRTSASGSVALDEGYYFAQVRVVTGRARSKTELIHIYSGHTTVAEGAAWDFDTEEGVYLSLAELSEYLSYLPANTAGEPYPVKLVFDMNNIVVTNTGEWNAVKTIISSGGNNQGYSVYISGDVGVEGSDANTFGTAADITVTLWGNGKLYLTSTGRIITLAAYQTLIIDSAGLTLQGLKNGQNGVTQNNTTQAVCVNGSNAQLELRNGTISGNSGGGVSVDGGTFTMNGGEISGNTSSGVYMYGYGDGATFTMNGGEISGNSRGVELFGDRATFTMSGGVISGNTSSSYGGGVYVFDGYEDGGATFTMNGGVISGNTSSSSGGGVYVNGGTSYTMNGEVYEEYRFGGTFTMNGGEISGNTAPGNGGGGGVYNRGIFRIVTGTVYGSDAGALSNTARVGQGWAALYSNGGKSQRGTFNGETWVSNGDLSSTNNTIRVVDGELQ